jgi:hypothetical protein
MADILCTHCRETKPVVEFYPSTLRTSTRWCKACCNEATRSWELRNRDKVRARIRRSYTKHREKRLEARKWNHMLAKYGLDKSQYVVLLAHQEHRCAVCDGPLIGKTKVCVDHNHSTGKVRGLLCDGCNRGIGLLKDNPVVLGRAAQYVAV